MGEGGTGLKVGDHRVVPLCDDHHIPYVHRKGQPYVEKECGVSLEKISAACWQADGYHRMKYEREWRETWGDAPLPYEAVAHQTSTTPLSGEDQNNGGEG
jgi:hypothetical protein